MITLTVATGKGEFIANKLEANQSAHRHTQKNKMTRKISETLLCLAPFI